MHTAQDMNTVIETSQNSPVGDALGAVFMIIVTLAVFVLFKKDKW